METCKTHVSCENRLFQVGTLGTEHSECRRDTDPGGRLLRRSPAGVRTAGGGTVCGRTHTKSTKVPKGVSAPSPVRAVLRFI